MENNQQVEQATTTDTTLIELWRSGLRYLTDLRPSIDVMTREGAARWLVGDVDEDGEEIPGCFEVYTW